MAHASTLQILSPEPLRVLFQEQFPNGNIPHNVTFHGKLAEHQQSIFELFYSDGNWNGCGYDWSAYKKVLLVEDGY
jgi:hypothetical protein